MTGFLESINSLVWGNGLIALLLFTGIIYTFRLRFIQLKVISKLVKCSKERKNKSDKGLSQWKTVCMSLGTAMGTGNITGVAAAVALGGAGAVFWMWVSALLGMALVYAENYLSVKYSDETFRGPMAYLKKGLGCPLLAAAFAVMCLGASVGMGGMMQVGSMLNCFSSVCTINRYVAASVVFLLIFLVISGGATRIGSAAQALLPAASVLYMAAAVVVIFIMRERIPSAFSAIFGEALGFRQAVGGGIGTAVSVGIRRGIFSNEAGLGSSPILHSAAESDSPKLQGLWSMFEVFFDTIICCTLTALVMLCTSASGGIVDAFSCVFGNVSGIFLSAESAVFAFCTVIGWFYCGEVSYKYLSGRSSSKGFAAIYAAASAFGAILPIGFVWILSDIFNGLMAIPNLLGLLLLVRKVSSKE